MAPTKDPEYSRRARKSREVVGVLVLVFAQAILNVLCAAGVRSYLDAGSPVTLYEDGLRFGILALWILGPAQLLCGVLTLQRIRWGRPVGIALGVVNVAVPLTGLVFGVPAMAFAALLPAVALRLLFTWTVVEWFGPLRR
jgi:hypothetical protein